ncbi:hypothetical protein D9Q98_005231 [Chlorella vulgaris]|uniref:Uncharacterized protein n=1 Tax=Chlorella vulgaris TaxID=3077 RepID=A0A9D4TP25_CHLVU|nr:hypothetical protein D9Q98_005231 [Chlorella vulgaris]
MDAQEAITDVGEVMGAGEEPGGSPDHQHANGASSSGLPAASEEASEEEPIRKRLWFLRMPRPSVAGSIKSLEQELETFRAQHNLITESLNVKKVERDSAREATRAARDAFMQCRAAYDERSAPLKKLQEQRQDANANANKLKANFSDLLVRSEGELDQQLAALHYRIEHETISLNEEKKALGTIKKLEQQRERVREYEASASLFAESKSKRSELQEVLRESEGELSALRQEMDVQRQILDKLKEHEQAVGKEVEDVMGERRRCKELMDGAFHRLSAQKKAQWEKNNAFYTNRAFSREVRKLLAEGKQGEAAAACAQQMDEAVAQLAADAELRSEYFSLWEQQRKTPVVLPSADDVDANLPPPSSGAKGGPRKKAAEAVVDPAKKAEATIAALMEEAREEARRARAAAAAAAAAEHESSAAASAAHAAAAEREAAGGPAEAAAGGAEGEAAGGGGAAGEVTVVGAPPELTAGKGHHGKAHKAAAAKRPPVEPVVVPEEKFELPEAARLKEKTPSSHELKELDRERNRQAREEAERRKGKKAAEKQRKRERQDQLARAAAAAATSAAEAAASAQAAAASAARLATAHEAEAGTSDSASSDGGAAAPAAEPAASAPEQRKRSGGKQSAPLPVVKAMAPKPAARRPAGTKQSALMRQAKRVGKEYSLQLLVGLGAVALLAVVSLVWTAMSVAPQ